MNLESRIEISAVDERQLGTDIETGATLLDFPFGEQDTGEGITLSAMADDTPRLLYDRKEAARQLSISTRSLDYLIANRKLDTRRIGKKVLIPYAELKRFAKGNHYDSVITPVA